MGDLPGQMLYTGLESLKVSYMALYYVQITSIAYMLMVVCFNGLEAIPVSYIVSK